MHPRGRVDLVSAILENLVGKLLSNKEKQLHPIRRVKMDGYKQMETFAIEQVMILMRFEHELAIFAKKVDVR